MAFGFGFNKAKVLSAAEKFVQQGKLQNAISEYEKIVKEDPKDLTVLNTIGDLYARVGQGEKACEYFKKVGDQYAQNGFTVKAIAIYKKLSKLTTSNDAIVKLAELYTHQGLFNDARSHYMQIADQLLKSGDNNQAAKILQKILELDPENTSTQSKLADLYIKLGRKEEARNIYYSAAESLYARKAFDACDDALGHVLSLDPDDKKAILLRGMTASEAGDVTAAVQYLEQVPDLDSHPDGLRALLRAKLQTGAVEGTEALAVKLFNVHQDLNGITALAEWQVAHQRVEEALKLYDQYAERLFSAGASAMVGTLYPLIARVRDNPAALERMLRLLQKAGDTSHLNEVMELLAHARVQSGNFEQARDLYKELSELEPENPLHVQNYKQMLAKLGEDPMSRTLSREEGTQALMVEELEHSAPTVHQEYSPTIEKAIDAALTDAELFISYNVPLKAIAPLEAALPIAPRDLRLNQRLASLYLRAGRYADAVNACKVLSEIYAEAGHEAEARRYAEEAQKYSERAASEPPPSAPAPVAVAPEPEPPQPVAADAGPTVKEFVLEVPGDFFEAPAAEAAPEAAAATPPVEEAPAAQAAAVQEFKLVEEPVAETPPESVEAAQVEEVEIDVSEEWESMVSVEPETAKPVAAEPAAAEPPPPPPPAAPEPPAPKPPAAPVIAEPPAPAPPPPAVTAPPPQTIPVTPPPTPAPIAAAEVVAGPDPVVVEEKIQEIGFYISQGFWDMAQAAVHDLSEIAPKTPELAELKSAIAAGEKQAAEAAKAVSAASVPAARPPQTPVVSVPPPPPPLPPPAPPPAPAPAPAPVHAKEGDDFVLDVDEELPPPSKPEPVVVKPPAPPVAPPPPMPQPVAAAPVTAAEEDILGNLVQDLEESLGDFLPGSTPAKVAEPVLQPAPAIRAAAAHASPTMASTVPAANNGMSDSESASVLSNILSELQEDLGEEPVEAEDPETHYNLGIAFKEMGLLDEAIGELQKVCHSVEHGTSFSQPVQAFTWLAQCLVDKGVPEAAIRWYQKALQLPGLDDGSRCAIYYDLGSAYEASGDRKSALANFMEVYSSNIDFRDVASRIKVLKS